MRKTLLLLLCGLMLFVACGKKENIKNEIKLPDKTITDPVNPVQTEDEKDENVDAPVSENVPKETVEPLQNEEAPSSSSTENTDGKTSKTEITPEEIASFLRGNNPGLIDKVNGKNN